MYEFYRGSCFILYKKTNHLQTIIKFGSRHFPNLVEKGSPKVIPLSDIGLI